MSAPDTELGVLRQCTTLRGPTRPTLEELPGTLAAAAAAWTAAHDHETYRKDLAALIDVLLVDARP